ncbi:MAG: ubiquinol-cytochrome C chaperone [Xanthobacteraceae bacterium]|nr:ubiquinol-cytochrome C chaperone [Xanthobacteraceae bacterium]
MIWWRPSPQVATIDRLYGTIVAQARLPVFYTDYDVADTLEGRFEMLVLHQALTARRLASYPVLRPLGAALFDRFCRDLDHNLREMGVTDLGVPKKMHGFAAAYFGRARIYEQALNAGAAADCEAAIARNVFGQQTPGPGARRLAHYMGEAARALDDSAASSLSRGELSFPDPATIPMAAAA